jgi:hypothetical protein
MTRSHVLLGALVCGISTLCAAGGVRIEPPPQEARYVPGELIVKFSPASQAGQVAAQALLGDARQDAQLQALEQSLSRELNVHLDIRQITSGREIVLSVDTQALVSRVVEQLRTREEVKTAKLLEAGEGQFLGNPKVLVEFAPGSKAARSLSAPVEQSQEVQRVVKELEGEVGARLIPELPETSQLILVLDLASLTADLLKRIRQRGDVEYAQPNVLLQPLATPRTDPMQ